MRGRWSEVWDRIVASDPGLSRLRMAGSAAIAMASALAVEYAFATVTRAGEMGTVIAMLLGAVMAMMGSMALAGTGVWVKIRTAVFFPVAIGAGMIVGVAVGNRTDLMLGVFVVVMFVAVAARRFGIPFFFYGFMAWMGYFFASFLHATVAMMPALLAAVGVATGWVLLLSVSVLRTNPGRTLARTVHAFDARARAVTRACADLLRASGDQRQRDRLRRRVFARQAQLNEAALMVEAWSAESGALPADRSAPQLRRQLIDAQQVLDRLAAASMALTSDDAGLASAAASVADRLAWRDGDGANRAAHALAESAQAAAHRPAADRPAGWLAARQFAVAAIEFVALARQARRGERAAAGAEPLDEFEPVVALAMGNLPGSPAVAREVPPRSRRWNPLARLDMTTRQAIQVAIAGGLAILLGRDLSATRYYWAVIAAFVMFTGTATRAETFLKGFNRVLGTFAGLVVAVWLAELTAGNTILVLGVVIASMFCGVYLVRLSYAYMIFFITIMVGQLYAVLHEFSPGLLVLRLEETAIGAAAGIAVSLLVTPLSTRDTVRTARDNFASALADLLRAVADRLGGTPGAADDEQPGLDALSRTLDNRLRQLTLVAKPLTRPLLWGNSPVRIRHRLTLYAATATHARALAVALRRPRPVPSDGLGAACRALAAAAGSLTEITPGRSQPAVGGPLREAEAALFTHTPAAPGARATDPVIRPLIHLQYLLRDLAATAAPPPAEPTGTERAGMAGTVTDSSGEPIHGRVLLLADGTGEQAGSAYSDSDGRYQLAGRAPGHYLAVVTATGHRPTAARVSLLADRTLTADFTMDGECPPRAVARRAVRISAGGDHTLDLTLRGTPAARHTGSYPPLPLGCASARRVLEPVED